MGRLGGPARATVSSGKVLVEGVVGQFRSLKGSMNGQLDQNTGSSRRRDHHSRGSNQRQESEEEQSRTGVRYLTPGKDFYVRK